MKYFVVFACCIAVSWASAIYLPKERPINYMEVIENFIHEVKTQNPENKITVNVDKYVDDLIKISRLWIVKNDMDPLRTEDVKEGFTYKIWPITWHGEFSLTNGWMQGLSTVQRSGESTLNYEAQLLNMRIYLTFNYMNLDYDYLVKFMNLGPTGGVEAKIANLKIYLDVTVDLKNMEVILQGFKIADAGRLKLKFNGNPLVDWITNIVSDIATRLLHNVAINVVQKQVKGVLENAIANINDALHPSAIYLHKN